MIPSRHAKRRIVAAGAWAAMLAHTVTVLPAGLVVHAHAADRAPASASTPVSTAVASTAPAIRPEPAERNDSRPPSNAPPGQPSPKTNDSLALRGPDLGFPGVGRVLLGFLLCAGLAVGAAFLLRRYWPSAALAKGAAPGGDVRVLGRVRVETSLRVHVVEASGTRVLIAEGRSGVTAVVLPASGVSPPSAS